jgi:chromosome segregation ATPase
MPEERISEAIEAKRADLAAERASLVETCKANKSKRQSIDDSIIEKKERIAITQDKVDELQKAIDEARSAMERVMAEANSIPKGGARPETAAEASLRAKVAEIEQRLAESRSAFQTGTQDINKAIIEHQEAKKPYQATLADLDYYNRQQDRLAQERENLKAAKKKLAVAEQKRECASQFLYAKLRLMDENVSKVFGGIKIKLIQENINGGFDPVCKPFIYDSVKGESTGVTWSAGSKSEKVETGIAICEVIKKALGLPDIPYLFDEGGEISTETFDKRLPTESQLICVKVRDGIMSPTVLPL